MLNCPRKMNPFLFVLSAVIVASATVFPAFAQETKGDASAGEKKNAMCIGCHGIVGYHAGFPEVYKVPKISGQGGKYIAASLHAYKKGERKHPSMRGVADTLSAQDIADLAAYYEASGAKAGSAVPLKIRGDSAKALELIAKGGCTACHGENLNTPLDASYPKIAGQHSDYLYAALKAYKIEGNAQIGRSNAIMGGVAKQFSNEELKTLANYIGSLNGELKTVQPDRFQ